MTPTAKEKDSPEAEHENHRYLGYEVPWYVHVLWVLFWLFAIGYVLYFLFPILPVELRSPP